MILDDKYSSFKTKKINNIIPFTIQFSTNVKSQTVILICSHILNIGNFSHCFFLFCSEGSNLNLGSLVNIVLLDCDTNLTYFVICYVILFVAVNKLLIHSWLFFRNDFQCRNEIQVFSILTKSISNCSDCFFFFSTKIILLIFFELPQLNFFE